MNANRELLKIRILFEQFEKTMVDKIQISIDKHGMEKVSDVMADIANIREKLYDLHLKMYPPKK